MNTEKSRLRAAQKKRIQALPHMWRREADDQICRRIAALEAYKKADTVFCYVPLKEEIDIKPLLLWTLEQGKRLAVPLCMQDGRMEARQITSFTELRTGRYGIAEPFEDAPAVPPQEIGFAVAPGLGFDKAGGRLGRGGGYYDRYLAGMNCTSAGVCYEALLLPKAPRDPWDQTVGVVVTERAAYKKISQLSDMLSEDTEEK